MSDPGLDRFLAARRERKARQKRAVKHAARTANAVSRDAVVREMFRERVTPAKVPCKPGSALTVFGTEPAMVACTRCSHLVVVSRKQFHDHRRPENPDGDPHYCKHCTNYFAA